VHTQIQLEHATVDETNLSKITYSLVPEPKTVSERKQKWVELMLK